MLTVICISTKMIKLSFSYSTYVYLAMVILQTCQQILTSNINIYNILVQFSALSCGSVLKLLSITVLTVLCVTKSTNSHQASCIVCLKVQCAGHSGNEQ